MWFQECAAKHGVGAMTEFALTIGDTTNAWVCCTTLHKLGHFLLCTVVDKTKLQVAKPLQFVRSIDVFQTYFDRVVQQGSSLQVREYSLAWVLTPYTAECKLRSSRCVFKLERPKPKPKTKSVPKAKAKGKVKATPKAN